jgi:predicted metal-dependent phosphoesterase TrpH
MKNIQSLHSHTNRSDGTLSPMELLAAARRVGVAAIAFTDHDSVMHEESVRELRKADLGGTNWISGIEISSGLPKELGGGAYSALHIVGLFVDPTNIDLVNHCQNAQEARIVRMQKMVKNLQNLGFTITEDDCLKASGGEAVGRPHIVEALGYYPQNEGVTNDIRERMRTDAQNDAVIAQKYELILQKGELQAPYGLYMTEDSYISDVYVEYQYWTNLERSVELVRNAGGLAVIAHYSTARNKVSLDMVEKYLKEGTIDGVETVYGLYAFGKSDWNDIQSDRLKLRELANKYSRIESGGSDAHTAEDLEAFAKSGWYADETDGFAKKIIKQTRISTEWSSFS